MPENFEIRFLKRAEINVKAWDHCIAESPQGLIYAYSFYLDNMADNWDALVLNDYEIVMPLPWRKKLGIRYVYQLPFVQRLGIYGGSLNDKMVALFYEEAIKYVPFFHYKTDQVYSANTLLRTCKNLILDLSNPYSEIKNGYSQECLKNIKKAENRGCTLQTPVSAEVVVEFFKNAYGNYYSNYDSKVYEKLKLLIEDGCKTGLCKSYSVQDECNNSVFAAALFQDNKRIYYCVGAPIEQGRKIRATYFFINEIIKQSASQKLLFDFEGSEIPSVASFYSKFNPIVETYSEILINRLPFPFNRLKK